MERVNLPSVVHATIGRHLETVGLILGLTQILVRVCSLYSVMKIEQSQQMNDGLIHERT